MERLVANGRDIETIGGHRLRLRGFCAGGWMMLENFINGYPGTESELRAALAQAIGPERSERFFNRWLDALFGEADIRFIASTWANAVRLPMNYRHFETDAEPGKWLEPGFKRVRQALDWCEQYEVYGILDLHAAPGWQNPDWHSDNATGATPLWQDPYYQNRTVQIWEELANRFGNHPALAGYDLLNEPASVDESNGEALNRLYRRLVRAIRSIDPKHLIFLEGNMFGGHFKELEPPFKKNLVYSLHDYSPATIGPGTYPGTLQSGLTSDADRLKASFKRREGSIFTREHNVPLWVGEFGVALSGPPSELPDRLRAIGDHIDSFGKNTSWTIWPLKDVGHMGLLTPAPDSAYMRLVKDVLQLKQLLRSDHWIGWQPADPGFEAALGQLNEVISQVGQIPEAAVKGKQGRMLGSYIGNLLLERWLTAFAGLTDAELDEAAESFAFDNCIVNEPLLAVLQRRF